MFLFGFSPLPNIQQCFGENIAQLLGSDFILVLSFLWLCWWLPVGLLTYGQWWCHHLQYTHPFPRAQHEDGYRNIRGAHVTAGTVAGRYLWCYSSFIWVDNEQSNVKQTVSQCSCANPVAVPEDPRQCKNLFTRLADAPFAVQFLVTSCLLSPCSFFPSVAIKVMQ